MKVLVVGSGGREHALAWKAAQSPLADIVYVAPGNPATAREDKMQNVDIKVSDIEGLAKFAKEEGIGLTIVGPEAPLVAGIVDEFSKQGLTVFGPSKAAAALEGSKSFTKDFLKRHHIPTAAYEVFTDTALACEYIKKQGAPIVIKADGLAAGKGVVVAMTEQEAIDAVHSMLDDHEFGDASASVVIEEFMEGEEASFIVMADTKFALPMATSQDHKRVGDGDTGPNTGGMGAFSPSRFYTDDIAAECMETIFKPTVAAMEKEGRPFKGVLYFGLMLTPKGPRVIEYNARFGDPETQAVLSRLDTDLFDIFNAVIDEKLEDIDIKWADNAACCVCMASGGYPKAYEKGKEITGLDDVTDSFVFHAGTAVKDGKLVTNGGRVLGVTATAPTLDEAIQKAYADVKKIHFDKVHYRTDIGVK